ncbi:hypothetical protein NDU88_006220 [Pleurodeles waltl]|uniref:Uncharacterized protein n=1 Tax=Pleurodeles waltl TaxID=8319 RepID=A0AAV7PHP0_PLEWA|nr:hypothetical protein NDU88_006220 [Pleurodeles waltl]
MPAHGQVFSPSLLRPRPGRTRGTSRGRRLPQRRPLPVFIQCTAPAGPRASEGPEQSHRSAAPSMLQAAPAQPLWRFSRVPSLLPGIYTRGSRHSVNRDAQPWPRPPHQSRA